VNIISKVVKRKIFHVFLLAVSVFLLMLTAVDTNPGAPEASVFWYASSLQWTFWPGLSSSFLAILLSVTRERKYLGLVSVLLPVFYLYALPSLVHDMLPVFDVYHVIPSVLSIVETGSWNSALIPFPASHIYQASSIMIMDLPAMTYARIFPTILAFTIAIFIFTIAGRISKKWAPIAPLAFLALNWYMEYHLARQPFGVMIWTAFWLTLFIYLEERDHRLGVLSAAVLLALIPAHPGMLIIASFNILSLSLVVMISLRDGEEWSYFRPFVPIVIFFATAAVLFYNYVPAINEYMNTLYEEFRADLDTGAFEISLGGPSRTSFQYGFVNRLRMLSGAVHSLLGLLGFITLYRKASERALLLGAWFFSIFLWLIYPLTHEGLYMERPLLASLIPASVLAVALLKHCWPQNFELRNFIRISVIVILAALLLVVPITKNSVDAIETPSNPAYRAGLHAEQNIDGRIYVTDTHQGMFRYIESGTSEDRTTTYQFRARGKAPPDQPYGYRIPRTDRPLSPILFTDYFNNYLEIRYDNTTAVREIDQYESRISQDSARVYDSGGARLYLDPS